MNYRMWCLLAVVALGLGSCAQISKKPADSAKPAVAPADRKSVTDFLTALDDHDDVHRVYAAFK